MTGTIVICGNQLCDASFIPAIYFQPPGQLPPGLYETVLWSGNELILWEQHLSRFLRGCEALEIDVMAAKDAFVRSNIEALLQELSLFNQRARVRLMAFKNPQPVVDSVADGFTMLAAAWPAPETGPETDYKVSLSQTRRSHGDLSYNLKLTGRMEPESELSNARAAGWSNVLMLNDREEICETPFSNVWLWVDGVLRTPPLSSPCLPGVTRAAVIRAAIKASIYVDDRTEITLSSLSRADEVFLTSSIKGYQPITSITGLPHWKPAGSPDFHSRVTEILRSVNF